MSDKTPGERAFEKFFEKMAYPRPNLEWADSSPQYKAAWEAAAEEGHVAHIDKVSGVAPAHAKLVVMQLQSISRALRSGDKVPVLDYAEPKPGIDWLAINRSCS